MITEDQILELRNSYIKNSGISENLALIIHPSKTQEIIDLIRKCEPPTKKLQPAILFGMEIFRDSCCPKDKIYVLPEFEFLEKTKPIL